MDLKQYRARLDAIDSQLAELFRRRMETVRDIAAWKKANGAPVLAQDRERDILRRTAELCGQELEGYAGALYSTILALSRDYQEELLSAGQSRRELPAAPESVWDFTGRTAVACQDTEDGLVGAACGKLFALPQIAYFTRPEDVLQAVADGMCRCGVLPAPDGRAAGVYALIEEYNCKIVRGVKPAGPGGVRFLCVSSRPEIFQGAGRVTLAASVPHRPGSLFRLLSRFAVPGFTLCGLDSRPVPGREPERRFYFDVEVPGGDVRSALSRLAKEPSFAFLGAYSEVS